jgi:putative spermidine/putrescine transport system permease protein
MRGSKLTLNLFCCLVYAYLLAPIVVVVGASLNAGAFLTFPPQGLSLRWFGVFLSNQVFIDAIIRSGWIALLATMISACIGTAAALYYARHAGAWKEVIRIGLILPLILPEVLTAMALLFFVYAIGIGTRWSIGLIIGHVLVTLPFVFLNVVTGLHGLDGALDLAARSLGASPWAAFRRITLPLIKPSLINGCLFAFIVSFDTFGISFLLKGVGSATCPSRSSTICA